MGEVTNEEILIRLAKIRTCPKACPKFPQMITP